MCQLWAGYIYTIHTAIRGSAQEPAMAVMLCTFTHLPYGDFSRRAYLTLCGRFLWPSTVPRQRLAAGLRDGIQACGSGGPGLHTG